MAKETRLNGGFRDSLDFRVLNDPGFSGRHWNFQKKVAGGTYTRVRLDMAVVDPSRSTIFSLASVENILAAS